MVVNTIYQRQLTTSLFLVLFAAVSGGASGDVLGEALAVEPGFAAVDVAHVDQVLIDGVF